MTSTARLNIDLNALARNFHALVKLTGVPVHPVVKADSYGLGAVPCTRRLMSEGADTVFVARTSEGVVLRNAIGPDLIIYVLDGCVSGTIRMLQEASLRPVINQPDHLSDWLSAGSGPCGLQIDTGMNRLGFRAENAPTSFDGLALVMSHLACADAPHEPMNTRQRDDFAKICQRYPDNQWSFANSGGCFLGPDFAFDVVRPGICLYGGGPEARPDSRIATVAALTADILQVRDVPSGESIGYSRGHVATTDMSIATCGAGYADGILRSNCDGGQVWVEGELRPIIGRVSMDVIAVDVTGLYVQPGDTVELIGPNRLLDDAAHAAGTIAYEILTSISPRVPRRYIN